MTETPLALEVLLDGPGWERWRSSRVQGNLGSHRSPRSARLLVRDAWGRPDDLHT